MKPVRILLVALAALRLTRLITSDHLGEWLLVGRIKLWAWRREARGVTLPPVIEGDPGAAGEVQRLSRERLVERIEADYAEGEMIPTPNPANGWRSKLVSGLDCPFCVGFWIGALVLLGELIAGRSPRWLRGAWSFGLGALGLNYLVGHVSKRID